MENGVRVVDGLHIEEKKGLEDGVSGERVEEMKDFEGDEVFEEAVDTPSHLPEQGKKSESADGNGKMVGDSGVGVVDGDSNIGHEVEDFEEAVGISGEVENFEEAVGISGEVENFEEAIGVPGEIGNREVEGAVVDAEEKVENLVGGGSVRGAVDTNKIDEGGTGDEAAIPGLSGLWEDRLVGNGENKEVSDTDVYGGVEVLDIGNHEDKTSGVVTEQLESGASDNKISVEMPEVTKPLNGEIDRVREGVFDSFHASGPNGNIGHEDSKTEELKENNCLEFQDEKVGELTDASAGLHYEAKLDTEHQVDESDELKAVPSCHISGHLDDKAEELSYTSADLDTGHQDERNGKVEDSLAGLDTPNHIGTCELKDTSADLPTSMENVTVTSETGTSEKSIIENNKIIQVDATCLKAEDSDCADENAHKEDKTPEKSIVEKDEKIQDDATSLTAEGSDCVVETAHIEDKTPEKSIIEKDEKFQDDAASLRVEVSDCVDEIARKEDKTLEKSMIVKIKDDATSLSSENSDFADEIAHKVSNNHDVAEETGKKEEKHQEESTQAKGEPKIQPASNLASASGRSTNPAPSPAHPAGLGRAAPLLEPAPRAVQQPRVNGTVSQMQTQQMEDTNGEVEEYDETREQLQMIRVKFLRLAHRLGQTPHNVVVAQVLYRLGLAEQLRGRNGGRVGAFSFDRASAMAEQLEAAGQEPLDFSCTIMVLGKTGVGKSATINSIFDEHKFGTDAFEMGTKKVQDVVGTVQGIKVRVIDTPGLLSSWSDQRQNEKILHSVKRFIKKTPPDIVLYLDRLDMQSRDFSDMPLLRTITDIFGPSIWFNAIVVLTHAASAPPDGPNGTASSYDMFVTQRSHVVQQAIRQAAGDMRLMNPVSLVENHSACRTNRAGQRVLPNGQVWKPHLLLLSFASKILAEANTLLKLQDGPPGKPFATRSRGPPLPFLLSSLLQSRPQLKLPGEQVGSDEDDLDESSDSDDESEYDDLPPFTHLTKAQVAKLTKAQKKAYFDELEYREKLFMKKQLKEEKKQRKMMKKMAALAKDLPSDDTGNVEEESGPGTLPAPMPDLALPVSFDSSNPTHRYRCLDSSNQWLVRPVLDNLGWDHDVGYEGINVERFFVIKDKVPVSFSGQVTKDKKDANIQMEINSSLNHGEGKATSMGFDLQNVGKDMAYTLRGETRFSNHRKNKATAGLSVTALGDAYSAGVKVEDKLILNKCFNMVMAGGAMTSRGDVAYGGSVEAHLRDKDYPIGRFLSTLGLSIMDWHGDLAIGGHMQSQIPIGRSTNLIARANLNNRGAGQISIRLSSTEHLQIALPFLIPLLRKVPDWLQLLQHGQQ